MSSVYFLESHQYIFYFSILLAFRGNEKGVPFKEGLLGRETKRQDTPFEAK